MKIINLDISHEVDYLKFIFDISSNIKRPIKPYIYSLKFSEKDLMDIQNSCQSKIENFNQKIQRGVDKPELLEEFKDFGLHLGSKLLHPKIKSRLKKQSIGDFLRLSLDDVLLAIPWELILLDDIFLCRKFNMGRIVTPNEGSVDEDGNNESNYRKITQPLNMFIIANPGNDLESAEIEGSEISLDMDIINPDDDNIIVEASLESDITIEKALSEISKSHIVHFAGHAEYDVANPNARRWKFASGYLTSSDIDKIAGSTKMPVLVVSNACQSGCAEKWTSKNDISVDLVHAFLRAGVGCYIGTLCKIVDQPSSYFAKQFYEFIVKGKSVGEAVRLARESFIKKFGEFAVGWAIYIVYGDPTLCLFDHQKNIMVDDDPVLDQIEKNELFQKNKFHISNNPDSTTTRTASELNQPLHNPFPLNIHEAPPYEDQPIDTKIPDNNCNAKKYAMITGIIVSCFLLGLFMIYWLIIAFEMHLAVKKETETADLITKINKNFPFETSEKKDHFLKIAFDFSSLQFIFFGIDTGITSDIVKNITSKKSKYFQKNLKFLEREYLNTILDELNLTKQSTGNLYKSRLFLYLDFRWHFFQSIIHTRLLDVETGERIELADYTLEDRSIKTRKKIARQITEELLKKLIDHNYLN
jgi:CHAT domain-containing protein